MEGERPNARRQQDPSAIWRVFWILLQDLVKASTGLWALVWSLRGFYFFLTFVPLYACIVISVAGFLAALDISIPWVIQRYQEVRQNMNDTPPTEDESLSTDNNTTDDEFNSARSTSPALDNNVPDEGNHLLNENNDTSDAIGQDCENPAPEHDSLDDVNNDFLKEANDLLDETNKQLNEENHLLNDNNDMAAAPESNTGKSTTVDSASDDEICEILAESSKKGNVSPSPILNEVTKIISQRVPTPIPTEEELMQFAEKNPAVLRLSNVNSTGVNSDVFHRRAPRNSGSPAKKMEQQDTITEDSNVNNSIKED